MRCVLMDGAGQYPLGTYIGVAIPDGLIPEQEQIIARQRIIEELDRYAIAEAINTLGYRTKQPQEN